MDPKDIIYAHVYGLEPVLFQWGIKDFGFGEVSFSYNEKEKRWECQNETLKKETVKAILCKFVDESVFME